MLPASAHSLYYVDLIGNISTSDTRKTSAAVRFRVAYYGKADSLGQKGLSSITAPCCCFVSHMLVLVTAVACPADHSRVQPALPPDGRLEGGLHAG